MENFGWSQVRLGERQVIVEQTHVLVGSFWVERSIMQRRIQFPFGKPRMSAISFLFFPCRTKCSQCMKELTGSVSGQSAVVLTLERLGTSWASVLCLRNAPRNKIFEAMQRIM